MTARHERQLAPEEPTNPGPGTDDEATRTVSSSGPTPGSPADLHQPGGAPSPEGQQEKPETEPSAPAGEPEAPTGPSRPHGDELEEATRAEPGEHADDEGRDHERRLEHDLDELTAKAEKADEYLELAQRTKADFENYRKRAVRETAAAEKRGMTKLARELLPAVDNLDRALAAAESVVQSEGADGDGGVSTLVSGIKLVHEDVIAALARCGIEGFSPQGERFDPQHHEAVAQQPVEGAEPGTVVEVYQRGYRLGNLVLRPARVLVAG
jgi:molecular chaperone GrpE